MIVLNGLDSGGDTTFFKIVKKKVRTSLLDYIAISDNLFFPDHKEDHLDEDSSSDSVPSQINSIPVNSSYIPLSMKILNDYKNKIGDHFLISCQLLIPDTFTSIPCQSIDPPLLCNIPKWNRNDHGDLSYWEPMRCALETNLLS